MNRLARPAAQTSQMNGGKEAPPRVDFEQILACIVRGEGETSYVWWQRESTKSSQ